MKPIVTNVNGVSPLVLQFEENQLLPLLYGDFDRHLARIEQALGVSIASSGNTLTISGAPLEVDVARLSSEDLYGRLVEGLEVSLGEVDAAVRLARDAVTMGEEGMNEVVRGGSIIRPKRHLSPRSPGQKRYPRALLKMR